MTLEKIKCPNCNATIKIYPDDIMVTCDHCGDVFHVNDGVKRSEHKVKHTDDAKVEHERAKRDIEIERIKAEAEIERIKVEAENDAKDTIMSMVPVIAMFAVIGIIIISVNYIDSKHKEKMAEQGRTINIGYSSEDCSGKNYELVSEELSAMGFDNIVMVDLDDSGLFKKENTIESITIEGKEFSEDDYFSGNEKVVISYH